MLIVKCFQQQIKNIWGADRWYLRVMMLRCEKDVMSKLRVGFLQCLVTVKL